MKNCSNKDRGCPNLNPQPLHSFNKNKTMKDGHAYECRNCIRVYRKKHRKTEKYKKNRVKWEEDNLESVRASKTKHYNKNKDKYTQYNQDYYLENKTHIREYQKQYYDSNIEKMHEQQKQRRNKKPTLYAYNEYKARAKKGEMEFELSTEEFTNLVCQECHYCLQFIKTINGIDRVDSNIGYVLSNCVPCCWICNNMKKDMSYEEFIAHIRKIANRFNNLEIISK